MAKQPLIDREDHAAELWRLGEAGGRKLALVYGRRRVGKTFLLTHLWPSDRAFYFTASAISPAMNRRVLLEEAARWSGEDVRPQDHPTWRSAFRALFALRPGEPLVVVLDEFQYLATDEAGLAEVTSELNAAWEGRLARTGPLLLVLSGSAVRTLEALAAGGSPLFGRLDLARQLLPFDYYDAGRMVARYPPWDRIRTYAAFGGLPKYLDAVDDTRPLDDNVVDLLLAPQGPVRLQLETVLRQEEGLRDYATYQGILAAVGTGRRDLGGIATELGLKRDMNLRRMVHQLVELGVLEVERNFEAPRNTALRYRIGDPALRMFFGLILPNESALATAGARAVWRERLRPQAFPRYVGREVFEDVVGQAWARHGPSRGLPAVAEWGRWEGVDRDRRGVEIDVVARLLEGGVLTGSVKFRRRKADAAVYLEHRAALERLASAGRPWAREALDGDAPLLFVSAGGFARSFEAVARAAGRPVIAWTLDDLF